MRSLLIIFVLMVTFVHFGQTMTMTMYHDTRNKTYIYEDIQMSYDSAAFYCSKNGANVISISDNDFNNWLMTSFNPGYWFWLNSMEPSKPSIWIDGTMVTIGRDVKQPRHRSDCATMRFTSKNREIWFANTCHSRDVMHAICEVVDTEHYA